MSKLELWNTEQAAERLGTTPSNIRMLLGRYPELQPQKIGKQWVFTREDIERLRNRVDRRRKKKQTE